MALARRRGIFTPAYEIYGGVAGLYEYGPVGARIKHNIESLWREHYVAGEGYLEIDAPLLAPEKVWEASGHLGEFDDALSVCSQCSKAHRADHLLEGVVPNPDALPLEELDEAIAEHKIKCPACGGALEKCRPFNLMFASQLGAGAGRPVYLRPETAQSIFVSFPNLLRQARGKLPFGVAQVGRSFRNEIAPRQGLIRLREFTHAEVEYFVLPDGKLAPRFSEVDDLKVTLVPNSDPEGEGVKMTIGKAVAEEVILNELVGYHVGKAYQFLRKTGLSSRKIRFRQHLQTEMAHYAADCWDGEALTSLGWIEIVGVADRGCYDLSRHEEFSGQSMSVPLPDRTEERTFIKPNKGAIGKRFKARAKDILVELIRLEKEGQLPSIAEGQVLSLQLEDETGAEMVIELAPEEFAIEKKEVAVEVTPHVIEPSFGIDRIVYSVLCQAMEVGSKQGGDEEEAQASADRAAASSPSGDDTYTRLKIPQHIAPFLLAVFPLQKSDGMPERARELEARLRRSGLDVYYDDSRSIGRRYARADEIGIPWCMTVDHQSLEDNTVTLRDRDTTEQVRVGVEEVLVRFE